MQIEIEAKFTDINSDELREKLSNAGATLIHEERLMRRKNYDHPNHSLEAKGGWIRVRDEGDQVTLAYKQLNDRTLHGTQEVSLVVEDFDRMGLFLTSVGFELTAYQETKREKWMIHEVEVTIDTWPWLPTFCELEGPSEDIVKAVATTLGYDWQNAMHGSVENVYVMHYDVTELEVCNWPEITFTPVPAKIEARRITRP